MTMDSTKSAIGSSEGGHFLCDDWFDPLETGVRKRIRGFIEELLEAELDAVLGRDRYERPRMGGGNSPIGGVGSRHRHRERGLMGTFGATTIRVPWARLTIPEGKTAEWRNATIPAYQRRTKRAFHAAQHDGVAAPVSAETALASRPRRPHVCVIFVDKD
jgi:hypothetical protein